jgi:hypothetical protein
VQIFHAVENLFTNTRNPSDPGRQTGVRWTGPGATFGVAPIVNQPVVRAGNKNAGDSSAKTVCQGVFLSRQQYLSECEHNQHRDPRLPPGDMSAEQVKVWTDAAFGRLGLTEKDASSSAVAPIRWK